MPELPEVETVRRKLKQKILNKTIKDVYIYYESIIAYPSVDDFKNKIKDQTITDIKRLGKWLLFILDDYILLSHLRMEGKYFYRDLGSLKTKHEHVSFVFDDFELRYQDVRKFGRMYLYKKDEAYNNKPLSSLGLEPWDDNLNIDYLAFKYNRKNIPIKTVLLDQEIITGIGNIYADEILFKSGIYPLKKANLLNEEELENIIKYTRKILEDAIKKGGTTIRSYTSEEGVSGLFQNNLYVHMRKNEECLVCKSVISCVKVAGRSTYFCPKCQKEK